MSQTRGWCWQRAGAVPALARARWPWRVRAWSPGGPWGWGLPGCCAEGTGGRVPGSVPLLCTYWQQCAPRRHALWIRCFWRKNLPLKLLEGALGDMQLPLGFLLSWEPCSLGCLRLLLSPRASVSFWLWPEDRLFLLCTVLPKTGPAPWCEPDGTEATRLAPFSMQHQHRWFRTGLQLWLPAFFLSLNLWGPFPKTTLHPSCIMGIPI